MDYCFYDVETTGIGRKDEVIQLAYILTDENLAIKKVFNSYCFSTRPINPDAEKVHGISRDLLLELSGGKFFEEIIRDNEEFFKSKDIIFTAYKDDFDRRVINQTLSNNTNMRVEFGSRIATPESARTTGRHNLCSYRYLVATLNAGRSMRLTQMAKTHSPEFNLERMYQGLCHKYNLQLTNNRPHDALYDSLAMWLLHWKVRSMKQTIGG